MLPKRDLIAEELRKQIIDRTYSPGDRLPTEEQLQDRYQVARGTVRDALDQLEYAGLIERRHGRAGGSFVRQRWMADIFAWRDDQPMSSNSEADLFARTVREQGFEPSQEFRLRIEPMPEEHAKLLNVATGDSAVVRRCIRFVNDAPHSVQDSWYPNWLVERVPRLRDPIDIPQGTTKLLADEGFVQLAAWGSTTAHMPTPDEAATLRIPNTRPVLRNVLTGYTIDGPLRISAASFNSDTTRLISAHGDMSVIERFRR